MSSEPTWRIVDAHECNDCGFLDRSRDGIMAHLAECGAGDADGWIEAMRQQQRVERALVLAAAWEQEAACLGRSLSELMLRDAARRLRAALATATPTEPEETTDE